MKRHLSTCHGLQDDDLKDGCIDKLKYKEAIDSRVENVSRSNKRKSSQVINKYFIISRKFYFFFKEISKNLELQTLSLQIVSLKLKLFFFT